MNASSHPAHTTAPSELPALLVYEDEISPAVAYVLHHTVTGWKVSLLMSAEVPATAVAPGVGRPLTRVEAGADLRKAERGASTVVTLVVGS